MAHSSGDSVHVWLPPRQRHQDGRAWQSDTAHLKAARKQRRKGRARNKKHTLAGHSPLATFSEQAHSGRNRSVDYVNMTYPPSKAPSAHMRPWDLFNLNHKIYMLSLGDLYYLIPPIFKHRNSNLELFKIRVAECDPVIKTTHSCSVITFTKH